jgi:hypothetical protein
MTHTVILIKDYDMNGVIKKKGTGLTVTKDFIKQLADEGYIETDKRHKKSVPKRSKIKIKQAVIKSADNTNIKNK